MKLFWTPCEKAKELILAARKSNITYSSNAKPKFQTAKIWMKFVAVCRSVQTQESRPAPCKCNSINLRDLRLQPQRLSNSNWAIRDQTCIQWVSRTMSAKKSSKFKIWKQAVNQIIMWRRADHFLLKDPIQLKMDLESPRINRLACNQRSAMRASTHDISTYWRRLSELRIQTWLLPLPPCPSQK